MNQTLLYSASALSFLLSACSVEQALPNSQTAITQKENTPEQVQQYTCPMHPHYISTDSDGSCPICGMDLVPTSGYSSSGEREILYYKHPMGQPDTSSVPKKDSMGMDYIPVYAEASTSSTVIVAPEMIQTMGVRLAVAETTSFGQSVRAFGTVEADERLEAVSASRLEGWIENLTVRAEGDTVRPGALLYRVYSPELIAAQKDYIASLAIGNENRIAAVRQRLRSIGMQNVIINRISETREVLERVPVYAEAGGTVDKLQVREGDYIKPGTPILKLQSYADVWIIASIPEQDLALIDTGMPVLLDFLSAPDASATGRVDYIYPTINSKTRTGDVRIEIDNSKGYLRPGAYADIRFDLGGDTPRLAVPTEAILRDSRGAHVIMALGEGRFAGRAVRIGISANGLTEILSGLVSGEQVVASGQFMLDSEVNLREGFSKLQAPPAFAAGPETPLSQLPVDTTTLAEIDHFTDMALYFHEALTDRYKIDPYFVDPALRLGETLRTRFADTKLADILESAETALRAAKAAREGEALAATLSDLMTALEPWLLEGAPVHYQTAGLVLYRETDTDRLWVQEGGAARNPYGNGAAETVDWPDPMAGVEASDNERGAIDPHSGHQ